VIAFDFDLQTENLDRTLNYLEGVLSPLGLTVFLRGPGHQALVNRLEERFTREGDDASGKWAELMDTTGLFRMAQGFPPKHPINRRTGEMFNYLQTSVDVSAFGDMGAVLQMPGTVPGGELGKKIKTAQKGAKGKGGFRDTPARPVLALSITDATMLVAYLTQHINDAVGSI
jgi:hypothetical protein